MTATLPAKADTGHPVPAPVTFILVGKRLVTVRYDEPRAFETFPSGPSGSSSAASTARAC